jgi:hypothetical protein
VVVWDRARSLWYNTTWPLIIPISPTTWYDEIFSEARNGSVSDCSECVDCMEFLISAYCDFSLLTAEEVEIAECLPCVESW